MQFQVMSRENAKQYSYDTNIPRCIIISINGTDEPLNQFNANPAIQAVCHLVFDDVEGNEANCMTREDADKIISFVNEHVENVDEIVVHCGAGISRSAGTCAALMMILNGDDSFIFDNPRYAPNMHCYRLVLESYFGYYDKEAADEKIRRNIMLWRKAEGLDDDE
jgi:predicted protein tyrosine phosphatase